MTTITAYLGFRLRMDASGNIPELNATWSAFTVRSTVGSFSAELLKGGPYSTRYTLSVLGEIVTSAIGELSGDIQSLSLIAKSTSSLGQTGLQLEVSTSDIVVSNASRLPLSLFLAGDDVITGSSLNDVIHGASGNDELRGRRGSDLVFGGSGNDTLYGGARDGDKLYGGAGDDTFFISDPNHRVIEFADEGNDVIVAGVSYDLATSSEVEILQATSGVNAINLTGSHTANAIYGNQGKNVLLGRAGDDTIDGGAGNDIIEGGQGADQLRGQEGYDQLSYVHSNEAVIVSLADGCGYAGDALGDFFDGFEEVLGTRYSDQITGDDAANRLMGGRGDDILIGAGGDDVLIGERGNDSLIGGAGHDRLDYSKDDARRGVIVNLTLGTARDGYGGQDAVSNFEEVLGTKFQDVIKGSGDNETLRGGDGKDRLSGDDGNDTLLGGAGNDTVTGGLGQDIFIFNSTANNRTNVDILIDFNPGEDRFWIDHKIFKNLGWFGRPLKDDFFHLGKMAEDKFNRIIYDKISGALYYDPDGTGTKTQMKIAILMNKSGLDSSDFFVI